jgi:hypothetical protein
MWFGKIVQRQASSSSSNSFMPLRELILYNHNNAMQLGWPALDGTHLLLWQSPGTPAHQPAAAGRLDASAAIHE